MAALTGDAATANKNKNIMITVIHHSADFDGIFCREIAKRFLTGPDTHFIGWDFADAPLPIPPEGKIYILDLPVDRVFGFSYAEGRPPDEIAKRAALAARWQSGELIWIDHHKSSMETHPADIAGYRIDGVSACRLAWQWFQANEEGRMKKEEFIDRTVSEPYAVRLAGEYDIWDKRDPDSEVFQFGLRSVTLTEDHWKELLESMPPHPTDPSLLDQLLWNGRLLQQYQQGVDAGTMGRSFVVVFEGLKFLALNTARCNSLTFAALDVPESGHDALMGFYWKDGTWNVSLYHARHRTDLDLSKIAVKYGGGGHRGACGFRASKLPFIQ